MTQNHNTLSSLILGTALALGLGTLGLSIYKSTTSVLQERRVLSVRGFAEELVKADFGTFAIILSCAHNEAHVLNKEILKNAETVKSMLLNAGYKPEEITLQNLSIKDREADYRRDKDTLRYVGGITIRIATPNVDLLKNIGAIMQEVAKKGIAFEGSPSPNFECLRFEDLRPVLLTKATQSAKRMAEQFAKDANARVGHLIRADQGLFSITNSAEEEETYYSSKRSIMRKIRVTLTAQYSMLS